MVRRMLAPQLRQPGCLPADDDYMVAVCAQLVQQVHQRRDLPAQARAGCKICGQPAGGCFALLPAQNHQWHCGELILQV